MSEPEQISIRNSVPDIVANEAYGLSWKRSQTVTVANRAGGTSTHLFFKSDWDASLSAIGLATDTGTNPQAGLDGLVAVMANGRAPR